MGSPETMSQTDSSLVVLTHRLWWGRAQQWEAVSVQKSSQAMVLRLQTRSAE